MSQLEGAGPSTALEAIEPGGLDAIGSPAGRPLRHDVWKRFRANRGAIVGLLFLGLMALIAILAPWIAPYSISERAGTFRQGPSLDRAHLARLPVRLPRFVTQSREPSSAP